MNITLKSAITLSLAAGTVALAGCGTFDHRDRSADRASDRYSNRTVERVTTTDTVVVATNAPVVSTNTPASVDPFSSRYPSFPAMANESAGVMGHSMYCAQHYNQPGCQTFDSAANERSLRHDRPMRRSDAGDFRSDSTSSVPNRY